VVIAADTAADLPYAHHRRGRSRPADVLVIGAGVAGLQAIATARRLGAVASAYDLRPAAKEQVLSLGGRFVELPLEARDAEDASGYARAQDESFYQRQRELLARVVAESDVVITAAVIPGKRPPALVTRDMVAGMAPGSVIVDLAAERGGNCELTRPARRSSNTASPSSGPQPGEHGALPCEHMYAQRGAFLPIWRRTVSCT
jgi:NAD(P) transhydrogenase subunit alpha